MKTIVLVAALLATAAAPVLAAGRSHSHCTSSADLEAEQAIRFMTNVMVASSACRNTVYAEFRLRNQHEIIRYQHEMIRHFHRRSAFDRWNTTIANEASMKQNGMPTAQLCQQVAPMFHQASMLDPRGFHQLAVAQAATQQAGRAGCR